MEKDFNPDVHTLTGLLDDRGLPILRQSSPESPKGHPVGFGSWLTTSTIPGSDTGIPVGRREGPSPEGTNPSGNGGSEVSLEVLGKAGSA